MAFVDFRFVNSSDILGTLIDIVSDSIVDHVEFDSGSGWQGAHYQDGVRNRPYNYMVPSRERVFRLEVSDEVYAKAKEWADSKIGTPYNFGAIASILFHDPSINQSNTLICSQYIYEFLIVLGFTPLNRDVIKPHDVTPGALMLSPTFDGKLVKSVG